MSKKLRTKIRIQEPVYTGSGVNKTTAWVDLGNTLPTDPARYVYSEWIPQTKKLRSEISDSVVTFDFVTATIRFNSYVNTACRILNDGIVYEILFANDPNQHRQWLQLDVRATVTG